jgi:ferredoxin-NADP reductase
MKFRVEKINRVSNNIRELQLAACDSGELARFEGGAHVEVTFESEGNKKRFQCSLCGDPFDEKYRIAVSENAHSSSPMAEFNRRVLIDDVINLSTPSNNISLDLGTNHRVFIASGIGIAPVLSMVYELHLAAQSFELHYLVTNLGDAAFLPELKVLCDDQLFLYESDKGNTIAPAEVVARLDPESHVFTCGPKNLIEDVRVSIIEAGREYDRLHCAVGIDT